AGIVLQKPVIDLEPQEWTKVIDVNLNGMFYMLQAFGRYLINNNIKGSIVNTASMSATIVNYPQQQASYNTAKAGVVQLTKSVAVEWAEHGIRVNCISPGYIFTELTSFVRKDWRDMWIEQTPMKRMGTPEELAGSVIFLLSDASSYASGTDLIIDGGFTTVYKRKVVSILIDGIIFDLDGTLWDSTHTGAKYWTQAAQNEGVDATITSEQLKGLYGLPTELIAAKLFPKESETKRIQIMSESTKLQNKVIVEKGGILYPSVKEVIYRIKETYPLYIVSNCLEGYIQAFIKAHQLEGVFEDFEYPGRTKLPKADNIQMLMER